MGDKGDMRLFTKNKLIIYSYTMILSLLYLLSRKRENGIRVVLKKNRHTFFIIFAIILPVRVIFFSIQVILLIARYRVTLTIYIANAIIKEMKSSSFYSFTFYKFVSWIMIMKETTNIPKVTTIFIKATPNLYLEETYKFSQIISCGYPKF